MLNERLREAIVAAHIDIDTITQLTNVDLKTVQRWLKGRVPHPRHRWKLAELLKEREDFLWPNDHTTTTAIDQTAEIVAAYAHRSDVSPHAWWQLFLQAEKQIDLLGYAMQFLPEQHSHLVDLLQEKATHGCKIRIALADPTCAAVHMRDEQEQLGGTLSARIKTTLHHFRDICHYNGIEIHYHSINLYNSLFRCDNRIFITPYLYGQHGSKAPLLHLPSLGQNGLFANFSQHFETVWTTTQPLA